MPYPSLKLLIDGQWIARTPGGSRPVVDPASAELLGDLPNAGPEETESAARAAARAFAAWSALTAIDRCAFISRATALIRERSARHRAGTHAGAGQAAAGIRARSESRGGHHRFFGRGVAPARKPGGSAAHQGDLESNGASSSRRARRRVYTVEFSGKPSGPQARRGPRGGLHLGDQAGRRNPGNVPGDRPGFCRCRSPAGRAQRHLRRPLRDIRRADRGSGYRQSLLHRLRPGGQNAGRAGGPISEALHRGVGRSCAGDRLRRCPSRQICGAVRRL